MSLGAIFTLNFAQNRESGTNTAAEALNVIICSRLLRQEIVARKA